MIVNVSIDTIIFKSDFSIQQFSFQFMLNVGNTMQEDFGFLNVNNCYAEKTAASNSRDSIDLESSTSSIFNKNTTKIKLEDSPDINKWSFNYGTNFLRTSDDPLISSVNNGCDQVDNELLRRDSTCTETTSTLFDNMNNTTKSRKMESTEITTHVKRVTTRTRRKGPLKLRFHHQALPPEYLNHYESQQQQQQLNENLRQKQQQNHPQQQQQQQQNVTKKTHTKTSTPQMPKPPVAVPFEKAKIEDVKKNNESIISWLQNVLEMQHTKETKSVPKTRTIPIELIPTPAPAPTSSRTQCLSDLPYMGEMTLENMKPRRGRKPKKADICHLIYKNYGTVIPGSNPTNSSVSATTSVTEKKSSETKKKSATVAVKKSTVVKTVKETKTSQHEPLNLCIREKREDSSILISDDNESNDFPMPLSSAFKPIVDPCENSSIDLEFSSTIPSLISPLDLSNDLPSTKSPRPPSASSTSTPVSPGYVYWPNAGLFIHPMAFYYQKMMNKNKLNHDSSASSSSSSLSSMMNQESSTLWDQNLSPSSIDMKVHDFEIKSEEGLNSPPVLSEMLKNTTLDSNKETQSCNPSQKRKRSAIFIPPVQSDNPTSPTNEVSICKFKFTGGAKPSLQEKKILSVDSGGNFRYYSGTGDKNMRGYEFFPRESLMQSSLQSSSHTNAFLNAESEKIPIELLPPISSDLNAKLLNLNPELAESPNSNFFPPQDIEKSDNDRLHRKKKSSNRTTQRAKLEKTFKEKGFLIQTQQLESAEGATYCKFRQLKKFTRYLFRSWKDYLPAEDGVPIPADCQTYPNNFNHHENNNNTTSNNDNNKDSSP
ncbi:unnamed protein product [Chironomus riparius]|uniref:Uncharacterized protein n=1 Tax=Chironomus riparius TaxID=315576 RepID=A0A9N9S3N2_9DIPT|nr:unnamed protein product [Chironomus riparius]